MLALTHLVAWLPYLALCVSAAVDHRANIPQTFAHPGLLNTNEDFARITHRVQGKQQPWLAGWNKLVANSRSRLGYVPRPTETICRGLRASCQENYGQAFGDYAACYQHALRWKIEGDTQFADNAVDIINAWSSTTKFINGSADKYLAAGIYGYQFANCVELMRDYAGMSSQNLTSAINLLINVFWPLNKDFLDRHNGFPHHYWANWDLPQIASGLSIGVLADDPSIYNFALDYFFNGIGQGSIHNLFWKVYDEGLAQCQESGRDQGHTMLDLALTGVIATTVYNQGTDLWSYADNLIFKGAQYVAEYNLGFEVPFTPFVAYWPDGRVDLNQTQSSPIARGNNRPIWEMYYNEYIVKRGLKGGLNATFIEMYAARIRLAGGGAEGGGGDYGPNSGGYDQLGFGTLLYSADGTNAADTYNYL